MPNCRFCQKPLEHAFLNLGLQPPSNSFLSQAQLEEPEVYYPLKAYVCNKCWLVQVPESKKATEIFKEDYPYYSSQSPANVTHAKEYVEMVTKRFNSKHVLEIGSNDGYLLQHFMTIGRSDVGVKGVDPSVGPAGEAWDRGIVTDNAFFGIQYAQDQCTAIPGGVGIFDLICSINTIAHQPDINDFVEGIRIALAPGGVTTHEFPWLLKTIKGMQFDQFYHEHYSYFSLSTIQTIFATHGLDIFDVDFLPEHGGSLRIYAQHCGGTHDRTPREINNILTQEQALDIINLHCYASFQSKAETVRSDFMRFLYAPTEQPTLIFNDSIPLDFLPPWPGKIWYRTGEQSGPVYIGGKPKICAYGAPAKANTFLNFCKVTPDLLPFTVDISPHKQGRYLPGSHIPVLTEQDLINYRPDYVLVLAWNLKHEIIEQLSYIRKWNGKFVIAIPTLEVI